jgi:tetratricopeptide (TPR) repeat protein
LTPPVGVIAYRSIGVLIGAITVGLLVVLAAIWPPASIEQTENRIRFTHKSPPPPGEIDPPFGFHWSDSMAHVEALLAYSSAEVVLRLATGDSETWVVEGLIEPGLKRALFVFDKNVLNEVELEYQDDSWPVERYRAHLEELRKVFDSKYGDKHSKPLVTNGNASGDENRVGYGWRSSNSSMQLWCRSLTAPDGRRLSVANLVIQYRGNIGKTTPTDTPRMTADPWKNEVSSPVLSPKYRATAADPPAGSDFALTEAKLLNTSAVTQSAFALQLAVELNEDAMPDPTKAVVEVYFYDTLPDDEIVMTDAEVNYDWRSRRDWKEANPETLTVTYVRKVSETDHTPPARKFFGYIAAIYYDGRLQAIRAEPLALVNLFPLRSFISPLEEAQSAADRRDFVSAARLYRQSADQGNLIALEKLAWFYARGKGVPKDTRRAANFYQKAALQNTPRALNVLAWFLATCPEDSIRNGAEAVRHATKACELTSWQEWKYIDTLAAAWAETGDFQRAIEYEQQALELKNFDEDARKRMEDRLALYRKRQPVRD